MKTYERIIFLDSESDDRDKVFEMIEDGDHEGAVMFLEQWHYPGEHETSDEPGHGTGDDVYHTGDYILSWNSGLEYVSLEYEVDDE